MIFLKSDAEQQEDSKLTVYNLFIYACVNSCGNRLIKDKTNIENKKKELAKNKTSIDEYDKVIDNKHHYINVLTAQAVNTTGAKNGINKLIENAGFRGFKLQEKLGRIYTYELVRTDGSIVEDLSEGERNFIAFLYLCYKVIGNDDDTGVKKR